jgi:hypothetical protein
VEVSVEFSRKTRGLIESAHEIKAAVGWSEGLSKYCITKSSFERLLVGDVDSCRARAINDARIGQKAVVFGLVERNYM